jgi:hypothetical protein
MAYLLRPIRKNWLYVIYTILIHHQVTVDGLRAGLEGSNGQDINIEKAHHQAHD